MDEDFSKNFFEGVIYSEHIGADFKPSIWLPNTLTADVINKVMRKTSAYFLAEEEQDWVGKILILPVTIEKFLGLTYFYKKTAGDASSPRITSITLLINEKASDFFYRNVNRIQRDLEFLAKKLTESRDVKLVLSEFYTTMGDFIERYLGIRKSAGLKEKLDDVIKGCVVFTYFNHKLGPKTFYMYPENALSKKQVIKLNNELELSSEQGLFIKSYSDMNVIHLYFELESRFARGNVEMCLISLVFEELPSKEMIDVISFRLLELIDKLYLNPEITIGFYEIQYGITKDKTKIQEMNDYLHQWVREVYQSCIEHYFLKSSEGEFASILMNLNRVKLIEKLSEGPIELNKLESWFKTFVDNKDALMGHISFLTNSNYAAIMEISEEKCVLLLKGLRVYRVPPTITLEKLKLFRSIYPEIYPELESQYLREIRRFFRKYKETIQETVLLSQLIFDPINYLIITRLRRGGIFLREDLENSLNESIRNIATVNNFRFLREQNIITEILTDNEHFVMLKTDIKFIKTIPKYIISMKKQKEILPEPLKKVIDTLDEAPKQIKDIFKRWFA